MRKQTAPQTRKRQKASPVQQSGLIAQGKTAAQSATQGSALDNRSHRTSCGYFACCSYRRSISGQFTTFHQAAM